jgi:hypothetical protein
MAEIETNPYAAPLVHSEPEAAVEYRSHWLSRVALRLIRGRERKARLHQESGEYEMFQATWLIFLFSLFAFVVPAGLLVATMIWWPGSLWTPFGLCAASIGLAALLRVTRESVYFTDTYVRRVGPFYRKVVMQWDEIHSARITSDGSIVLTADGKRQIWVHLDLHGHSDLLEMMKRRLPPSSLHISEQSMLEFTRL